MWLYVPVHIPYMFYLFIVQLKGCTRTALPSDGWHVGISVRWHLGNH